LDSPSLLSRLLRTELMEDADKYGDKRRSLIVSRTPAQALTATALISNDPVTVILSEKGWIRSAKGHDSDVKSLNYRSGDGYLDSALARTTHPVFILDSTGRIYTTSTHDLPSARSQGEPLTGRLKPAVGAVFTHLLSGRNDDWVLLASEAGYGFRVQVKDLISKNKAGKALVTLPAGMKLLTPQKIADSSDLIAVASLQGRLLVFPIADLPALTKGKGNKLMQIPSAALADNSDKIIAVAVIGARESLQVVSGKRTLTMKSKDLENYLGVRAKRGQLLPRGFQRVEQLMRLV